MGHTPYGYTIKNGKATIDEAQSEQIKNLYKNYLSGMSEKEKREFGNARGIRNLFETLVVNQANRIVTSTDFSVEQLTLVKEEDMAWLAENRQ